VAWQPYDVVVNTATDTHRASKLQLGNAPVLVSEHKGNCVGIQPSNLEFAITLENQGDADLVVLLGAVYGKK
jgi:hypothetical protein